MNLNIIYSGLCWRKRNISHNIYVDFLLFYFYFSPSSLTQHTRYCFFNLIKSIQIYFDELSEKLKTIEVNVKSITVNTLTSLLRYTHLFCLFFFLQNLKLIDYGGANQSWHR